MSATIREHTSKITQILKKARVESPGLSARVLVAHIAKLDEIAFLLAQNQSLEANEVSRLYFLTGRLLAGEPLAQILGQREFYGRSFLLNNNVLIPRPETELLADLALKLLPKTRLIFADLGCGTGCIGLTLVLERPNWQGIFLDKSEKALTITMANQQLYQTTCSLLMGDMFHLPLAKHSLDLIIANPPYIGADDEVMDSVRQFEPACALFSDNNGLAHLEAIIKQAKQILKPGGLILLEHGCAQGRAVITLLEQSGLINPECHKDLAGLDRCSFAWNN